MTKERSSARVNVRVALVITRRDRILLAGHEKEGRSYWVLPGGRLEPDETLEQCGRRELAEEAHIDVRVGHLLYLHERMTRDTRELNVVFRGHLQGGEPELGSDPENRKEPVLRRLEFVSRMDFQSRQVYPERIGEAVLRDWKDDFPPAGRYV